MTASLNVDLVIKAKNEATAQLSSVQLGVQSLAKSFLGVAAASVSFREAFHVIADFEQGLVGVGKTSNISGAALRDLGSAIADINRKVPAATSDLLEIAQAAGQMGIQGAANITKFTETIARLQLSSDLGGAEAAETLARMLNITGESVETVDRLASVIVDLGNKTAASESEIARAGSEIARSTAVFGVSSTQALALGASIRAVGLRYEEAGSVIGRVFIKINDVVRAGGTDLKILNEIVGATGDEFKKTFQQDANAAFIQFLEGLNRVIGEGGNVTDVLRAMGLEGDEINKTMPTMAKNVDAVKLSLERANAELRANAALTKESNAASDTLWASLKRVTSEMGQATVAFSTAIGVQGFLKESFLTLADAAQKMTDAYRVAAGAKPPQSWVDEVNYDAGRRQVQPGPTKNEQLEARLAEEARTRAFWAQVVSEEEAAATKTTEDRIKALVAQADADDKAAKAADRHAASIENLAKSQAEAIKRANEQFRRAGLGNTREGLLALQAEDLAALPKSNAFLSETDVLAARARIIAESDDKLFAHLRANVFAHAEAVEGGIRRAAEAEEKAFQDMRAAVRDDAARIEGEVRASLEAVAPETFRGGFATGLDDIAALTSAFNSGRLAAESLASAIDGGVNTALLALVEGSGNAGEAFKQFAKQMLLDITATIIKTAILRAILQGIGFVFPGAGAAGGFVASAAVGTAGAAVGGPPPVPSAGIAPPPPPQTTININAVDAPSFQALLASQGAGIITSIQEKNLRTRQDTRRAARG